MQPQLNAAQLLEAAASCPCTNHVDQKQIAAHKRRQQVVIKSLQPYVNLSSSSGDSWVAASDTSGMSPETQQALELMQQCQQQLDR